MPKVLSKIAKSKKDKDKVFKFRGEVLEASRIYTDDQTRYKEQEPEDTKAHIVYTEEEGNITGTFRTISLDKIDFPYKEHFRLEQWLKVAKPEEISFTSKFMTKGSSRKNRTILTLLRAHFELLLENDIRVDFIRSPEPTVPYYEWIGYKKIGRAINSPNLPWMLAPMALVVNDVTFLERINSPLLSYPSKRLQELLEEKKRDGALSRFLQNTFPEELITPTAYIQLRKLKSSYSNYFKSNEMKPFLKYLEHHKYINGERVFKKDEFGSSIHLIINGHADIEGENLGAGDFFGTACLLKPGKREFSAKADGELETLELNSEDFYGVIKDKPNIIHIFLELISEKVRDLNNKNYNKYFK